MEYGAARLQLPKFVLVRRSIKNQESSCNSRFARFLVVDEGDDGDEDSTWMNDG